MLLFDRIFGEKGFNRECPRELCVLILFNNASSTTTTEYDVWVQTNAFYSLDDQSILPDYYYIRPRGCPTDRSVTASSLIRELVSTAPTLKRPRFGARVLLGRKMVKAWSKRLPCALKRPLISCRTAMRTFGIAVPLLKSKKSLPPLPTNRESVRDYLSYIRDAMEESAVAKMLLSEATRKCTMISFVHIADVELCQTKCVPNHRLDQFTSSLCVVMCRECMGKSSNFSSDKKTGWFTDGHTGISGCVKCGRRNLRSFCLADCRVVPRVGFISNFYAFFPKPVKSSALLKPVWDPVISPCLQNRSCYGIAWDSAPHFKSAACEKCSFTQQQQQLPDTCEDRCMESEPHLRSMYLSAACNGCIISMLCCCLRCRRRKLSCRKAIIHDFYTTQTD